MFELLERTDLFFLEGAEKLGTRWTQLTGLSPFILAGIISSGDMTLVVNIVSWQGELLQQIAVLGIAIVIAILLSTILVVAIAKDWGWRNGIPVGVEGDKEIFPLGILRLLLGLIVIVTIGNFLIFLIEMSLDAPSPNIKSMRGLALFLRIFVSGYLITIPVGPPTKAS